MNTIGELAALATSFFFARTALIFTHTGGRSTRRSRTAYGSYFTLIDGPVRIVASNDSKNY